MKVMCDLRSEFPIKATGIKKPEKKIRASTGFEPVTSAMLYQLNYYCWACDLRLKC